MKYLTLLPDDYDPQTSYHLIIMLHGFGANMQDLAGLAPVINSQDYVYACPNAPIAFDSGRWSPRLRVDLAPGPGNPGRDADRGAAAVWVF